MNILVLFCILVIIGLVIYIKKLQGKIIELDQEIRDHKTREYGYTKILERKMGVTSSVSGQSASSIGFIK